GLPGQTKPHSELAKFGGADIEFKGRESNHVRRRRGIGGNLSTHPASLLRMLCEECSTTSLFFMLIGTHRRFTHDSPALHGVKQRGRSHSPQAAPWGRRQK